MFQSTVFGNIYCYYNCQLWQLQFVVSSETCFFVSRTSFVDINDPLLVESTSVRIFPGSMVTVPKLLISIDPILRMLICISQWSYPFLVVTWSNLCRLDQSGTIFNRKVVTVYITDGCNTGFLKPFLLFYEVD